jgi:DNA-binding MarR family transcriptional regulator
MKVASRVEPLVEIEEALALIVRHATLPRVQQGLRARTGLSLDVAALQLLRWIGDMGPVRLSDLADAVGLDVSTASRHVKQLETEGAVVRSGHPTDRRVSVLTLTPAGRDALRRLRRARRDFVAEALADWSDDDRAALAPLLGRLAGDVTRRMSP